MNEEFKTDKRQEYITKMRHNPVGFIEEFLGYKLNFFEKSYFRFQLLFHKKGSDFNIRD